jgi:hypothetical protein
MVWNTVDGRCRQSAAYVQIKHLFKFIIQQSELIHNPSIWDWVSTRPVGEQVGCGLLSQQPGNPATRQPGNPATCSHRLAYLVSYLVADAYQLIDTCSSGSHFVGLLIKAISKSTYQVPKHLSTGFAVVI